MRFKMIALLFTSFAVISCKNEERNKDIEGLKLASILKTAKVKTSNIHRIVLDSFGRAQFKRLEKTQVFNEKGYLVQETIPKYKYDIVPGSLFKTVETNIALGYEDTINYHYDGYGRLIEEEKSMYIENQGYYKFSHTYSYDKWGNVIKRCTISDDSENRCAYIKYTYDEEGRVKSSYDSTTNNAAQVASVNEKKTLNYSYDNKGNVIEIGSNKYAYNQKNQLIAVVPQKSDMGFDYQYDERDNLVKVTWLNYNDGQKQIALEEFFQYNDQGLRVESKEVRNGKIQYLLKQEYFSIQ